MKLSLLLIVFLTVFIFDSRAQCVGYIPSNADVVSNTQEIDGGFDPIWVCPGGTLHSDGGFHDIFLETGATMTTEGGIDSIWVKDGASFYMDGGIHVIFYVTASDLYIAGGIPTENLCSSLSFDYTNAPPNGCVLAPVAAFQSSDSSICPGTCISFSDLSENATSWQWFFSGASPSSSTDQNPASVCFDSTGSYDVMLVATNSNASDTLTLHNFINVLAPPSLSPISQSGDTLFSDPGYSGYQWYLGNDIVNGATDYFYAASQGGDYTVYVTDSNGCVSSQLLKDVAVGITELNSPLKNNLIIYPNPAANSLFLLDSKIEMLEFVDLFGRKLLMVKTSSSGKTEIDISKFPSVFFVQTPDGNLIKVLRH